MHVKAISRKCYSIKGVDLKIWLGFLVGKECSDSKKSDVLKTAESGNSKTVNYLYNNCAIFDGFVAILAKKHGYLLFNIRN